MIEAFVVVAAVVLPLVGLVGAVVSLLIRRGRRGDLAPACLRTCRVCGCTDEDCSSCIEATGHACWWVDDDLCSRCNDVGWRVTFGDLLGLPDDPTAMAGEVVESLPGSHLRPDGRWCQYAAVGFCKCGAFLPEDSTDGGVVMAEKRETLVSRLREAAYELENNPDADVEGMVGLLDEAAVVIGEGSPELGESLVRLVDALRDLSDAIEDAG